MIRSDEELEQSKRALWRFEKALRSLRQRMGEENPALYVVMAQDYLDDMRRIRAEVDEYIGAEFAQAAGVPLWLSLEGPGLLPGDLSSKILADWLNRLRKSVQAVAEFIEEGAVRREGRPTTSIAEMCDFRIVELRPGSIRVGLRLPEEEQGDLFDERGESRNSAEEALAKMLLMAEWAGSGRDFGEVRRSWESEEEMRLIARQVMRWVPSRRSRVATVRIEGTLLPTREPITLASETHPRLESIVAAELEISYERYEGIVREIDLDLQRVILRERPEGYADLRCQIPSDLLGIATDALDRRVVVAGYVSEEAPNQLDLKSIEILEEDESDQND